MQNRYFWVDKCFLSKSLKVIFFSCCFPLCETSVVSLPFLCQRSLLNVSLILKLPSFLYLLYILQISYKRYMYESFWIFHICGLTACWKCVVTLYFLLLCLWMELSVLLVHLCCPCHCTFLFVLKSRHDFQGHNLFT